MELVFVGWNHRGAPLDLRERLAFSPDRAVEAMEGLFREGILSEGAIVSTCNRAEVYGLTDLADGFTELAGYFSRFHQLDAEVLRKTALSARGDAGVRHLFRVASGLDSMVLGEAQILGQVKEAHRIAASAKTTRSITNKLFQLAVECGKRVRTETALGTRPASVPGIALQVAGRVFESLSACRVLLVGAGEMVELTARLLVEDGAAEIRFCNRTPEKAAALAELSGGTTVPWDDREKAVADADIVLTATGSPDPVLRHAGVKKALSGRRRRGPLLILDLAVPRDVEPEVDEISDLYRYDIDALDAIAKKNAAERLAEVPKAERIVEESVGRFKEWYSGLGNADVMRQLRERVEAIRREELTRYAGKLGRLPEADRAVVERLTETLVAKILHWPTVGLKEGDASERNERASAVRSLFRLGAQGGDSKPDPGSGAEER